MDRLGYSVEFKFANDGAPGEFSGYASKFGGLDSHGDRIEPGAYAVSLASIKASGRQLPMYMQHGARLGGDPRPVGVWNQIEEDGTGLKVKGRIVGLDTEAGRYNHALVKEGAMRGLSIGYSVPPGGAVMGTKAGEPRRTLKQIRLGEISIVDDPSDASAVIDQVKAAEAIKTIREFEDFLRDVGGYSHAAAKAIAAGGFKSQSDPRDEDGDDQVVALLKRATTIFKP